MVCHGMNKLNFLTTIIQGLRKLPLKKSDIFFGGAIQKRNSIRMDAVLFCLRSPNAEPPPSRPCGSDGIAPHQTNDPAHISARSGGYKSHLRNQKERDAHCVSLFFCFRSGFERLPAPGYPEVVDEQVKTLRGSVRSLTKPPLA